MRLAILTDHVPPHATAQGLRQLPVTPEPLIWSLDEALRPRLRETLPSARFVDRWDDLLTQPLDGFLFLGVSGELLTAARHLAQRGLPLLIFVDGVDGPAQLFDYMPIWQEHPHLLIPVYLSGMEQQADTAFRQFEAEQSGRLWKLQFHRVLEKAGAGSPQLSPAAVDRILLQDLHWICRHIGLPQHVTMQVSGPAENPAEVVVLLGGKESPEVRWVLATSQRPEHWSLELSGEAQTLPLTSDALIPVNEHSPGTSFVASEGRSLDLLTQLQHVTQPALHDPASETPWLRLIQLAEVGAVARRSLQRRRTLDIHYGEASERSQFKTQMTAIGCGALLWTMFGMISLLVLGGIADPRDREHRQSASAGFVMHQELFEPDASHLTPAGSERLQKLALRWSETTPVLIVEESSRASPEVNRQREQDVVKELQQAGIRSPEQRTVLRPVRGEWFEWAMKIGWGIVFAPLAIVLLLQLLILASREPAAN